VVQRPKALAPADHNTNSIPKRRKAAAAWSAPSYEDVTRNQRWSYLLK
jgi:hypothetical protein